MAMKTKWMGLTLASFGLAGCALPPIQTPELTFTVPYSTFVPQAATALPLPLPLLPPFSDVKIPKTNLPVPAEAKTVALASAVLNLKLKNTGPVPMNIQLFLSGEGTDPYAGPPLGGAEGLIALPRGGVEVTKALPIDVALLRQPSLELGCLMGSPGTQDPVQFKADDAVLVSHSVKVQIKLGP